MIKKRWRDGSDDDGPTGSSHKRPASARECISLQLRAAPLLGLKPRVRPDFSSSSPLPSVASAADDATKAKRTFYVSGAMGMDHRLLRELLSGREGWREVSLSAATTTTADFAWVELAESKFDPRTYRVQTVLKNLLVDEAKRACTDKGRLHATLQRDFPGAARTHLAETWLLRDVRAVAPGQVLIVRPVGTWARAGNGIVRVATDAELQEAKLALLPRVPDAIASVYLTDHLLWNGRKFHCRMYFLACAKVGSVRPFTAELWRRGKILTAAKPFSADDFWDRGIHDTHVGTTDRNLFFPEDLDGVDEAGAAKIFASMQEALVPVAKMLEPQARAYPEARFAYEVFGVDFLVMRDLRAVILEVNERIGFLAIPGDAENAARYEAFTKDYYQWVFDTAISPMFAAIEKLDAEEKQQQH